MEKNSIEDSVISATDRSVVIYGSASNTLRKAKRFIESPTNMQEGVNLVRSLREEFSILLEAVYDKGFSVSHDLEGVIRDIVKTRGE